MRSLKPCSAVELILTIVAFLVLVVLTLMAYYVIYPINWDGPGSFGVAALYFPFGFLYIGLLGIILLFWAISRRWRIFTFVMYMTVVIAWYLFFWPMMSLYKRAENLDVPLDVKSAMWPARNEADTSQLKTIQYGKSADSSALLLDYWPVAKLQPGSLHPVILKIHGGGWAADSRRDLTGWDKWFTSLGYVVFDVDYSQKGSRLWKQQLADLQCALRWVIGQSQQYQVDTNRISVMGNSSGAQLAMLLGYIGVDSQWVSNCSDPPGKIKTVINFYGPSNPVIAASTTGSLDYLQKVMGEWSPVSYINEGDPPTICFYGESDRIVPFNQGRVLDTVLSNVFVKHELYILPGTDHYFDANWSNFSTQIAREKIRLFLQKYDTIPKP